MVRLLILRFLSFLLFHHAFEQFKSSSLFLFSLIETFKQVIAVVLRIKGAYNPRKIIQPY